jgi:hypothetical protein
MSRMPYHLATLPIRHHGICRKIHAWLIGGLGPGATIDLNGFGNTGSMGFTTSTAAGFFISGTGSLLLRQLNLSPS